MSTEVASRAAQRKVEGKRFTIASLGWHAHAPRPSSRHVTRASTLAAGAPCVHLLQTGTGRADNPPSPITPGSGVPSHEAPYRDARRIGRAPALAGLLLPARAGLDAMVQRLRAGRADAGGDGCLQPVPRGHELHARRAPRARAHRLSPGTRRALPRRDRRDAAARRTPRLGGDRALLRGSLDGDLRI